MSAFRILKIKPDHDGYSRFMTAKVALADGHLADRQIEDHGTSVGVLPFDPERRVALLFASPGQRRCLLKASSKCWRRSLAA